MLLVLICTFVYGQNREEIQINASFKQQPLQDFIDTLETKYHLRVFYKQAWIDSFTINKNFQDAPLIQALNNVFLESKLTFRFYQDNGVVIFPVASDNRIRIDNASQLLIVGNPLNLGRYKKAILKGRVIDGKTGEPLVGAVVYDAESENGVSTDEAGLFEMELPTGDHRLRFSYMGFQASNLKVRLIEDGYEEFELFEESHNIGEITVMGENADLRRSQMSMVQMSSREIKYEYGGEELVYFSDRNKYRMPPYHRLDLSITFDENLRKKRMWKGSWTFSIYNVYGRKNPYSVYYREAKPSEANGYRKYSLYKLSVIGIPVPSLTYNFKF